MNIHRIVSDLVATSRVPTLQNKSLRVVEDDSGDLEVALDPVGTRPGDFVITISTSAARQDSPTSSHLPEPEDSTTNRLRSRSSAGPSRPGRKWIGEEK